jgi:hypothetical protein
MLPHVKLIYPMDPKTYWWTLTVRERRALEAVAAAIVYRRFAGNRARVLAFVAFAERQIDKPPLTDVALWRIRAEVEQDE